MEISAQMVKELREKTGAGMMDCKKALAEAGGDFSRAVDVLRERGIAKAASKEGRSTSEGLIATYIHPGDKLGVMIEINCETDFVARTDDFRALARDIAMQIAATNPQAVTREQLDPAVVAHERSIFRVQTENEKKPAAVIDKIVDGRIEKFYSEVVLLEQPFVKDNDKTVLDIVKDKVAKIGENIQVKRFVRFRLGE
jgi:elongation factor Ts